MRMLLIGDVFRRPDRDGVTDWLPAFRRERGVAFVVANGENATNGGINARF